MVEILTGCLVLVIVAGVGLAAALGDALRGYQKAQGRAANHAGRAAKNAEERDALAAKLEDLAERHNELRRDIGNVAEDHRATQRDYDYLAPSDEELTE